MPKTNICRDPVKERNQRVQEIIFGTGADVRNLRNISRATGIPAVTLSTWRREPGKIPFRSLCHLCDVLNVSPEKAGYLLTGKET